MPLDVPDGTPDRGVAIVYVCISLITLTSLATAVRVISKFVTKQAWWWDDLFALLAYVCNTVLVSLSIYGRTLGLGLHLVELLSRDPRIAMKIARCMFIGIPVFDCAITFPKLSAVLFYARVFRIGNSTRPGPSLFRIQLWIAGLLATAWLIATFIAHWFRCRPLAKEWNPLLPGHCQSRYTQYVASGAASAAINLYILILPVPLIWRLKASLRRRLYLLATFFLTYSVILLSVGRLVIIIGLQRSVYVDLTWDLMPYFCWSQLEASLSIISLSVPPGIALFKALRRRPRLGPSEIGGSQSRSAAAKSGNGSTVSRPGPGRGPLYPYRSDCGSSPGSGQTVSRCFPDLANGKCRAFYYHDSWTAGGALEDANSRAKTCRLARPRSVQDPERVEGSGCLPEIRVRTDFFVEFEARSSGAREVRPCL